MHTRIPMCAYKYVKTEMDQRGGVVIIFKIISHVKCESRKVVFAPRLFHGSVDDISALSLLPLAGNISFSSGQASF